MHLPTHKTPTSGHKYDSAYVMYTYFTHVWHVLCICICICMQILICKHINYNTHTCSMYVLSINIVAISLHALTGVCLPSDSLPKKNLGPKTRGGANDNVGHHPENPMAQATCQNWQQKTTKKTPGRLEDSWSGVAKTPKNKNTPDVKHLVFMKFLCANPRRGGAWCARFLFVRSVLFASLSGYDGEKLLIVLWFTIFFPHKTHVFGTFGEQNILIPVMTKGSFGLGCNWETFWIFADPSKIERCDSSCHIAADVTKNFREHSCIQYTNMYSVSIEYL